MGEISCRHDEGFNVSELIRMAAEERLGIQIKTFPPGTIDTPIFSGRLISHEVQPGLMLTGGDISYLSTQRVQSESEPAVMVGMLIEGLPETLEVCGHGTIARTTDRPAIFGFREPQKFQVSGMAAHRRRSAGVVIRPGFFDRFGDKMSSDGLAALREFSDADFRFEQLPRSPLFADLVRRCLDHPFDDQLGSLFLESAALALVIETAQLLAQERRMIAAIGKRHYDRVIDVRDILDANLASPPKIMDLTKQVGVNLTTLQANFKIVFGTTIFGYVRKQRLQMARVLLREYHLSVSEAGYRVGFVNPSAFTAAYRRHFGHPPGKDASRARSQ